MSSRLVKSLSYDYERLLSAIHGDDLTYITGGPGLGKTTLATVAMENMGESYLYVLIDCDEIASTTKIYTKISSQLKCKFGLKKLKGKFEKINSPSEFKNFTECFKEEANKKGFEKIYLILDDVEFFKGTPLMDSIVVLTRNQDVNIILISAESLQGLLSGIDSLPNRERLHNRIKVIELNPWTKDDLVEVICKQPPRVFSSCYENFVHTIVSLLYDMYTRNVNDLRIMCQESFEKFIDHYRQKVIEENREEEDADDTEIDISYSELEERFPPDQEKVVRSFISSFRKLVLEKLIAPQSISNSDYRVNLKVAYMIIAVYIAAYTRPADDKINFVKHKKRISRRARTDHGKSGQIHARPFTMERALQIFNSLILITDGRFQSKRSDFLDNALSNIQLLEDINYISLSRGDGLSSSTRYEISSNLRRDYVSRVAKVAEIDLNEMFGLN